MRCRAPRFRLLSAAAATCLLAAPAARALELQAELFHQADYTTNTARTDSDRIEEWINAPGVSVGARQAGAQLELDAAYQYQRRIYQEDLFDDENVTVGRAELLWHALPNRLDFTLRNSRSESTERALDPLTQANRQIVTTTEAGPTLRFTPRSGDELQIGYLYTDYRADATDTDNIRHNGSLRYILGVSASRTMTFAVDRTRVDFDNELAPDLDDWTGLATLAQDADRLSYSLGGGYTRIARSDGLDDVTGAIVDAMVAWQFQDTTRLVISAGRRIRDNSQNIVGGIPEFGDEINENTDLNEVFTEDRAGIELSRRLGNNQLSLRWNLERQDYEDALRDNDRWLAGVGLARNLTPRTTLTATLGMGRSEFADEGREFDEMRGALLVAWQFSRRFRLDWGARYEERDGNDPTGNFEEWIGTARLSYALIEPR